MVTNLVPSLNKLDDFNAHFFSFVKPRIVKKTDDDDGDKDKLLKIKTTLCCAIPHSIES